VKTTFKAFKLFKPFKTFGTIGTIGTSKLSQGRNPLASLRKVCSSLIVSAGTTESGLNNCAPALLSPRYQADTEK
jgi:hypothetical protein